MIYDFIDFLECQNLVKSNGPFLKNFEEESVNLSGSLCEFFLFYHKDYAKRFQARWDFQKHGFCFVYDKQVYYCYKKIPSVVQFLLQNKLTEKKADDFIKLVEYIDKKHSDWSFSKIVQFLKLSTGYSY